MPNQSGNAYGLTIFSPIKKITVGKQSAAAATRQYLQEMPLHAKSPMAKVPNTYLCRFYILNDVFYQSSPHELDHLKSSYIVFSSNFHGDLEPYLAGMWNTIPDTIKEIWQHCYGFEQVNSVGSFISYMKKCQKETTFYFNGSTDDALEEQLKSLYLKQEFSDFVFANQGISDEELLQAYKDFVARTQPQVLTYPTWRAGSDVLEDIVVSTQNQNKPLV